ncbi:MAG: dynamin family protein [Chromatiales bacterium]|jgi:hypothetical protein
MHAASPIIEHRLKHLETHLQQENPVLLNTVQSFRLLDQVAYRSGLLDIEESYAMQIPWWPLISVLGTFSAGKSSFINHYLQFPLQRSGNQAVDDKFTVICYSREKNAHSLPGVALDADPRFPFYQISDEIELVATGEGQRIDSYLQLKTCPTEQLRGKIIIDSPGFDADAQRTSTLRITDHIIDLSDLVLVFFDARHPEPGAMRDTLDHLVTNTIKRSDSGKFLYILNQIDITAREDNPEEVVAAWQRAMGERGLTAGRFYTIYNPDLALPIDDDSLRERFERKRNKDLNEIHERMNQVEVERAYRIVGTLEKTASDIEEKAIPAVQNALTHWRKRVLIADGFIYGLLLVGLVALSIRLDYWDGLRFQPDWLEGFLASPGKMFFSALALYLALLLIHFGMRGLMAKSMLKSLADTNKKLEIRGSIVNAFKRSTSPWRSIFRNTPAGWGRRSRRQLSKVLEDADNYVQTLNDKFTNPSGNDLSPVLNKAPDIQLPDDPELSRRPEDATLN